MLKEISERSAGAEPLTSTRKHTFDSGVELRLLLDQDGRVVPSPGGRIQAGQSQSYQTQPHLQHTD